MFRLVSSPKGHKWNKLWLGVTWLGSLCSFLKLHWRFILKRVSYSCTHHPVVGLYWFLVGLRTRRWLKTVYMYTLDQSLHPETGEACMANSRGGDLVEVNSRQQGRSSALLKRSPSEQPVHSIAVVT